jgi:glycosyltransferase involved in cell wall biosynthesis
MRIGIDAVASLGRGGNSTYSRELIKELLSLDTSDTFILISFLHEMYKKHQFSDSGICFREYIYLYVSKPYYPLDVQTANETLTKIAGQFLNIDLFHFTNPQNFISGRYKSVVTIHDLAPLHAEQRGWVKESSVQLFPLIMERISKNADAIIAVSEYTKRDLIETLGIDPERITVVYEAASAFFQPAPDAAFLEKTWGVKDYALYAGQLQPRKNILNLLKAWECVVQVVPQARLVLAGGIRDVAYKQEIEEHLLRARIKDSVILTGPVDDIHLRKLYSSARCFVYPSLFEGFGLPILEALQCGAPVIASSTTSLPEVVGNAGIFVQPEDTEDIAKALIRIFEDKALHRSLQEKTVGQAAQFSWKKAAQETSSVYTSVASSEARR